VFTLYISFKDRVMIVSVRINFAGEYRNAKCTNSVEQIPS